jgi:hypothetical protein
VLAPGYCPLSGRVVDGERVVVCFISVLCSVLLYLCLVFWLALCSFCVLACFMFVLCSRFLKIENTVLVVVYLKLEVLRTRDEILQRCCVLLI